MTTATTGRSARLNWGDGATALAAVGVGAFGAFAYYGDTILRPFAHTFGIWIFLVAVVSARQSLLRGALRGAGALLISVVAFFYGKQIYYDILYPGPGFPYRVQPIDLLFWGLPGMLGGAVLGVIASRIGRPGWIPAGASALLMGLLLADAYRWYSTWTEDLPMAAAFVGVIAIAALGAPDLAADRLHRGTSGSRDRRRLPPGVRAGLGATPVPALSRFTRRPRRAIALWSERGHPAQLPLRCTATP